VRASANRAVAAELGFGDDSLPRRAAPARGPISALCAAFSALKPRPSPSAPIRVAAPGAPLAWCMHHVGLIGQGG